MKNGEKLAIWATLLVPSAAMAAAEGSPGGAIAYSLVGGAIGGFLGSALACWWCCRRREKQGDKGPMGGGGGPKSY